MTNRRMFTADHTSEICTPCTLDGLEEPWTCRMCALEFCTHRLGIKFDDHTGVCVHCHNLRKPVYVIQPEDVGAATLWILDRAWSVPKTFDAITAEDVGRKVYWFEDHLEVESDEQLTNRKAALPERFMPDHDATEG